jgi:hypothetical protein
MGYALPSWRRVMKREGSSWRFDLPAANAQQLEASGVTHIEQASICTSCHSDEFYSHRAENGLTGRFAVLVYLRRDAAGPTDRPLATPDLENADGRTEGPESLHPSGLPGFGDAPSRPPRPEDPSIAGPVGHPLQENHGPGSLQPAGSSERQP